MVPVYGAAWLIPDWAFEPETIIPNYQAKITKYLLLANMDSL